MFTSDCLIDEANTVSVAKYRMLHQSEFQLELAEVSRASLETNTVCGLSLRTINEQFQIQRSFFFRLEVCNSHVSTAITWRFEWQVNYLLLFVVSHIQLELISDRRLATDSQTVASGLTTFCCHTQRPQILLVYLRLPWLSLQLTMFSNSCLWNL